MSKYTTGEIAKLCDVSVRTVQYYDTRNILSPSELSEGGRRLYSEDDLNKLKIICFLREMGLPINSIKEILEEEHPGNVISLLIERQQSDLESEMNELQTKLDALNGFKNNLKKIKQFSFESIGDIAKIMNNKKKLKNFRWFMAIFGISAEIVEVVPIIIWITLGVWWPFAVCMPIFIGMCVFLVARYYKVIDYICPNCHSTFKPRFKEFMFSYHTFTTRKLTCPHCGNKGHCVEVWSENTK